MSKKPLEYDPQLKLALEEMEKIAQKYECGYLIALSSKTHAEFKMDFPQWSLIQFQHNKTAIRVRTNSKDPELTDASFHLLYSIRDIAGQMFMMLNQVTEQTRKIVNVEHTPFFVKKKNR